MNYEFFDEGVIVGKFAPLTRGHINLINHASTQCKKLTVFLSYDDKFLNEQNSRDKKILTYKNRMLWLKKTFQEFDNINIKVIDESNIPAYPNGWSEYTKLLKEGMGGKFAKSTAIFSSEVEYDENYKKFLPEVSHVIVDNSRTMVPISATKIRKDIYNNWDMLPSIVRKDYAAKICVIGTESSGKSTMVKYLAKLYNTSWAEEYGREYINKELCGDENLLVSSDYEKIAFGHKALEEDALRNANKITFIDTNAFITEFYHRLYEGKSNPIVNQIAKKEEYDLILYLTDEVPWIEDKMRLNGEKRKETTNLLKEMIKEFPNIKEKIVVIKGDNYTDRMKQAMKSVDKVLDSLDKGYSSVFELLNKKQKQLKKNR
jgi:HTH-type transcriptional repressor of NAD biosynthesis genes